MYLVKKPEPRIESKENFNNKNSNAQVFQHSRVRNYFKSIFVNSIILKILFEIVEHNLLHCYIENLKIIC